MPTPHKVLALVLKTTDYGESDRVVSLFSEERGKLSAFARGARASRRRFGGALEPFTLLTAELEERPGAELWTLRSVAVRRGFGGLRADLSCIACAACACDVARALVRDHEPHPDLFARLCAYLAVLDAGPATPEALRALELGVLRDTGLAPRLDACARCGGPLSGERLPFDAAQGGALCEGCEPSASPGAARLSPASLGAALRLQTGGLEAADGEPLAGGAGAELRDALSRFVEHHLGRRLASRKFLDEVGPMLGG